MIFYTESGSTYELDRSNNQIRRLNGTEDPTPRQGKDGEWKKFSACTEVQKGYSVIIEWDNVQNPGKCTVTSPVKDILTDAN